MRVALRTLAPGAAPRTRRNVVAQAVSSKASGPLGAAGGLLSPSLVYKARPTLRILRLLSANVEQTGASASVSWVECA